MKNRYSQAVVGLMFAASLVVGGCLNEQTDSSSANDQDGPAIPASDTFVMETDAITAPVTAAATTGGFSTADITLLSTSNHNFAAFNVGVWNAVIVVGLAVPVAAFLESFNHRPVRLLDGRWLRSYIVNVGGVMHTAQLYASLEGDEVHWEMVISKARYYKNFTWFTGVSRLDGTSGYWILNKNPQEPVNLLRIDWHKDFSSHTGEIKYTNIEPDSVENGGYINYGATSLDTSGVSNDAFYDIYNKGQDDLIEIEWNRSSRAGRVRNLRHFGNEDWHYWDSAFQDTDPPA